MHNFERVQHSHSHDQLLYDLGGVILFQKVIVLHELKEVLALHQFSDNVDVGLCLDALLELQEEGVRHDLHDGALVTR